jgi:hypothetical protein
MVSFEIYKQFNLHKKKLTLLLIGIFMFDDTSYIYIIYNNYIRVD